MSNEYTLDTLDIDTPAGQYRVEWQSDRDAGQPYDEGFVLIVGADYRGGAVADTDTDNTCPYDVWRAIDNHNRWEREYRSGAAIIRYLRMLGKNGVTLVTDNYRVDEPSTDRFDRVHGVAWAPDDVPTARVDDYVKSALSQWRAWAEGDTFGWIVIGPGGDEIESVWGYYGFTREREYTLSEARDTITYDVEQRQRQASRVGAGFVGIV